MLPCQPIAPNNGPPPPPPPVAAAADAEVADELANALCTLSTRYELQLAAPGGARYGGAYCLLAHPQPAARRMVRRSPARWCLLEFRQTGEDLLT